MKTNKVLGGEFIKVVENQIKTNNPPETRQTYNRLLKLGIPDSEAKKHIAQCVTIEIFNVMKYQQPFDEKRYINNLNKLPAEPFDD